MKLRSSLVLLAAVAVASIPAVVLAEDGPTSKPAKPAKPAAVAGVIKSVDAAALSLVVTVGKGEKAEDKTFTTTEKTAIMLDGKKAALADLKAELMVKVMADEAGVASKIEAKTPKAGGDGKNGKDKPADGGGEGGEK